MLSTIRKHLTYANVVSTLCLFILLGGSAVAAQHFIKGKSIKPNSLPGNRLQNHTITGKQVNLGALGQVPNAANADSLGGSPASDYRLQCPAGLFRAVDICFEPTTRPIDDWIVAMRTCARANLRLPTEGELALVFNNAGAPQPDEWTSTHYFDGTAQRATALDEDASRQIFTAELPDSNAVKYRCVTDATN